MRPLARSCACVCRCRVHFFIVTICQCAERMLWAILLSALLTYNSHIFVFSLRSLARLPFRRAYCWGVRNFRNRPSTFWPTRGSIFDSRRMRPSATYTTRRTPATVYKTAIFGWNIFFVQININLLRVLNAYDGAHKSEWLGFHWIKLKNTLKWYECALDRAWMRIMNGCFMDLPFICHLVLYMTVTAVPSIYHKVESENELITAITAIGGETMHSVCLRLSAVDTRQYVTIFVMHFSVRFIFPFSLHSNAESIRHWNVVFDNVFIACSRSRVKIEFRLI